MSDGVLNSKEIKILEAFADALIPSTTLVPEKPSEVDIGNRVSHYLKSSNFFIVFAFRFTLFLTQYFAVFYRLGFKTFTKMSYEDQKDFLSFWHHRSFMITRLLLKTVETFIITNYYASEKIYSKLGYEIIQPRREPSKDLRGPNLILNLEKDIEEESDVCVIGSGAGGAAVAKELAEKGLKVIILEEGGRYDLADFKGESIYRAEKMYQDGGISTTMGFPPVLLPLGKAVGGTTVINSGTCFRTPDAILNEWAQVYGLTRISPVEMLPYFERVEKIINVTPVAENLLGGNGRVIARGLDKLGIRGSVLHRNVKNCEGSGLCCFGCPTDAKQSTQLNYIPMALKAGAKIYPYCKVQKINKVQDRVQSVEAISQKGTAHKIKIKAKVLVVAAGSIGTPVLLLRNKLANASGQLGRNLSIHPAGKALALFDEKIEGWKGVPQSYYADFLKEEDISFESIFTPPSLQATSLLLHGRPHKEIMELYNHIAIFGFMIKEKARGSVHLLPGDKHMITYSLTQQDVKKFVEGVVWLARIFFAAGAKKVFPCFHNLPELNSESDIEKIYRLHLKKTDLDVAAFHPLGTARMGSDPKHSVVNGYGRVHDSENMFITDGSILPTNLGVNPQVSIMAFATRTADHIHQEYFS